jgi:hypothetical protein
MKIPKNEEIVTIKYEFFSDVSIFGIKHAWEYYLLSIII